MWTPPPTPWTQLLLLSRINIQAVRGQMTCRGSRQGWAGPGRSRVLSEGPSSSEIWFWLSRWESGQQGTGVPVHGVRVSRHQAQSQEIKQPGIQVSSWGAALHATTCHVCLPRRRLSRWGWAQPVSTYVSPVTWLFFPFSPQREMELGAKLLAFTLERLIPRSMGQTGVSLCVRVCVDK